MFTRALGRLLPPLLLLLLPGLLQAQTRTWTSADGSKTFEGELLRLEEGKVFFAMAGSSREFAVPLEQLSEEDRTYLQSSPEVVHAAIRAEDERGARELWPEIVEIDSRKHEVEELGRNDHGYFIYRSAHFEFRSDVKLTKELVKHFSRTFEATRLMVRSLPLGLEQPQPENGYFQVRIFEQYENYIEAGAIPNSGGTYKHKSRQILVPLVALSVKRTSTGYRLNRDRDDPRQLKTLIHELTHQLTHDWIELPIWFAEGIAEYVSEMPYHFGKFSPQRYRVDNALESRQKHAKYAAVVPVAGMMRMTHPAWNHTLSSKGDSSINYRSAYLLVHYFLHMNDESGHAAPLRAWLRHMKEAGMPELKIEISEAEWEAMSEEERTEWVMNIHQERIDAVDYTLLLNGRSFEEIEAHMQERFGELHIDIHPQRL